MTSAQRLRELINERLTDAAEEIFRDFQTTISEYEEEINRQRKLLDILSNPEINLHKTELQQQHVGEEEEVLTDQQLCDQERNSSLDLEEPEPPQIKVEPEEPEPPQIQEEQDEPEPPQIQEEPEEPEPPQIQEEPEEPEPPQIQEELCTSLEGEQLVLKQETETLMWTLKCEESEDQTLDLSPDETRIAAEKEHVVSVSVQTVKRSKTPEPDGDEQLLSHNSHVAENPKGGQHGDSGSTTKPKPRTRYQSRQNRKNQDKSTTSKIHSNTSTGKQCFKCEYCGKSFGFKSVLVRHLIIHTGEKQYVCYICEKRFARPSALKVHMSLHTDEKPYKCDICGKGFSQEGKLNLHMRSHTGEKPYSCDTCGKRFSQAGAVKVHMAIHTGEKPYPCDTCGKRFSQMSRVRRHMAVHVGDTLYPCDICGKIFFQMNLLSNHMKTHRLEDIEMQN